MLAFIAKLITKCLTEGGYSMQRLLKSGVLVVLGLYLASCEIYMGTGCVGCHTDRVLLEEIADPIEFSGGSGEG